MKITFRQIMVLLTTLLTITVNGLANALPINGMNTGEISDSFETYFVPAGYVFSIWGVIYIGLIAFAIYQALPAQRENPRLVRIGWWVVFSNLANAAWIFLWHYQIFGWTLVLMLTLLTTLLFTYEGLRQDNDNASRAEFWLASVPFSIYLGWISVATIANASDVLYYYGWGQFGISAEIWMVLILAMVAALAWAMSLRKNDIAYLAVFLWALFGIGVKFPQNGIVTTSIWIAFGLIALAFVWAIIPRIRKA
ncbi:MAG: tryptophan-rich sensory protein [Chloroflexi bacterium]|nr:tryptophan-rich sensory protein [Chloroflexota bacterium]